MSRFFGLKLHIVINDRGELMAFKITSGKQNDAKAGESIMQTLQGLMLGDKGYIGKELFSRLFERVEINYARSKKYEKENSFPI